MLGRTGGDFDPNRTNFSYPRVPDGLDWISLDYYPDEGTFKGTTLLFQQVNEKKSVIIERKPLSPFQSHASFL